MVKRISFMLFMLAGCNVSPAPQSTGGVDLEAAPGCDRGVAVVTSDYKSTNIAISRLDGTTASASFISSGAAKPGLALAISGDVDVPWNAPASGRALVIDRYGTNVLTWMDLATAKVLGQLPVGTGFQSNPHDYLEIDAARAYVTRYGTNPAPGAQPFDRGGDLLVIDTRRPAILGRVAIPEDDPELQPCPDALTPLHGEVVVSLGRWTADFSRTGDGRMVGVSPATDAVVWTVDIPGLQACGRLAISPSGKIGAVACSSKLDMSSHMFDPAGSDIVIYDTSVSPPKESRRLGAGKKLQSGLQPTLVFASEDVLLALTYGGNALPNDAAYAVRVSTGDIVPLVQADAPYAFGGVRCSPGCGDICLLADARRNRLRRWQVQPGGEFVVLDDAAIDNVIGLPPRTMGGL